MSSVIGGKATTWEADSADGQNYEGKWQENGTGDHGRWKFKLYNLETGLVLLRGEWYSESQKFGNHEEFLLLAQG